VRNLFDQYTQPENRLTHALAVCLYEDRSLLCEFIEWLGVELGARANNLEITEQNLPGEPPAAEEDADRRGLPDIVIHDGFRWCLLIESKVQARLSEDQLTRHERTLRRRGFESVHRVVLTKHDAITTRKGVAVSWSGLYEWLGRRRARNDWAERLRSYLRAAEVRLAREEYLTEGTLTMFDGFHFSSENPYTYGEGKRLLNLATTELRKDGALKKLGMDPLASGRGAITGRSEYAVWDFLSLKERPRHKTLFTSYPHLTLSVHDDHLGVAVTVPVVRRRLAELGSDGIVRLNAQIIKRARRPVFSRGGWIEAYAVQRHYVTQRSKAVTDASVSFKLETSQRRRSGYVKHQPEWVDLFATLLGQKRSNIQFGYRVNLPWGTKGLNSRDSLRLISQSWAAMEPLLSVVRGKA
jgi:hypothetical protein